MTSLGKKHCTPAASAHPRINLFSHIKLFQPIDLAIWILVMLFFGISALVTDGDLLYSLVGAAGIVIVMFFVGVSIEVLLDCLADIKGLGTIVGFITNGPEALCLIVGLISGNILFAASTPLGSNIMNPLLLLTAAVFTGQALVTLKTHPFYSASCIVSTAVLAVGFFLVPPSLYLGWVILALVVSFMFFLKRPAEPACDGGAAGLPRAWMIPATVVLIASGYYLDPIVSFAAEYSHSPKGIIGFFVLAALTSWPEFKSALSLFSRGRILASVLNITVSNITNLWLAIVGVLVFLIS